MRARAFVNRLGSFVRNILRPGALLAGLSAAAFSLLLLSQYRGETPGPGAAVYLGFVVFFNILIPTFAAVALFRFVEDRIRLGNKAVSRLAESLVLALLFFVGLWLWATADVVLHNEGFAGVNKAAIVSDFEREFQAYLPVAALQALLLPWLFRT